MNLAAWQRDSVGLAACTGDPLVRAATRCHGAGALLGLWSCLFFLICACVRVFVVSGFVDVPTLCVLLVGRRRHVTGGHYIAFGKNRLSKQWLEFDDTQVYPRPAARIEKQEAYILFYQRRFKPFTLTKPVDEVGSLFHHGGV